MIAALAIACGGTGESTAPSRADIAGVALRPTRATIGVGSAVPLDAVVVSSAGDTLAPAGIVWSTSDADIARVSNAGVVTAVAVGSAQIAATVSGRSATAAVSVVPVGVASVQVSPLELRLVEGARGTVTARVLDARGEALTGRAVQWRSSNTEVATVSNTGVVTAVAAGSATIIAASEGRSASMAVSVAAVAVGSVHITPASGTVSVGGTRQLSAEVRDASNTPLPGRTVTWSTTTPSVVSVSSTGLVVGVTPGRGQVTASSGGRSASAVITVEAVPAPVVVARVTLSPESATLTASGTNNRTVQLTATAYQRDRDGDLQPLPGATFNWSSSEPDVASVSSTGLVTAVDEGRTTITVRSGEQSATAVIEVEEAPPPIFIGRVVVSPSSARIRYQGPVNRTVQLVARAYQRDEEDEWVLVPNTPFVWLSSNPSVATVNASGLVRGLSKGRVTITATNGTRFGTAEVEVERR